jgi:hypothetical protein
MTGVATEGHPYKRPVEFIWPVELFIGAALRGRPMPEKYSAPA